MHVTHLSTHDTKGGAAGSAYRLHQGLQSAGVKSRMYVLNKFSDDSAVIEHESSSGLIPQLWRRLYRKKLRFDLSRSRGPLPEQSGRFSDDRTPYRLDEIRSLNPDVINLHWVADFVDYRHFLGECVEDTPVVWRLSDLNPFTGGCHYDSGCGKYKKTCGSCPLLGSKTMDDLSRAVWDRKREAFDQIGKDQLVFVAQSEWIQKQVEASDLTSRFRSIVIPNGLDTDLFCPRNAEGMSTALEIPSQHRVVLFISNSVDNNRKGFDLLAQALAGLTQENITLLSIGGGEPQIQTDLSCRHLGRIQSDFLLSIFYTLADLFVIPSRQDNLPNTVLESMACGTPVVGFDTGGIPDMVRPGETGWLAEKGNVRDLRSAIEKALIDDEERQRRGKRCRKVVESEYTIETQARAYQRLYRHIMESQKSSNSESKKDGEL